MNHSRVQFEDQLVSCTAVVRNRFNHAMIQRLLRTIRESFIAREEATMGPLVSALKSLVRGEDSSLSEHDCNAVFERYEVKFDGNYLPWAEQLVGATSAAIYAREPGSVEAV